MDGSAELLKVSSRSNPNSVAGALAGVVRQHGCAQMQVIGAGALNQAIKAVAIARGYVAPSGVDLVCVPTFADVEIEGQSRTAIRLSVEDRALGAAAASSPDGEIDLEEDESLGDPADTEGDTADTADTYDLTTTT